ncbi:MAG: UDP-N-acetylmuramate dehydrogenase [Spirochaetaceae bacterium]|jgi:UDP-N-acetylmuramate dehydrogenase|nr:UDP-N-acetylmuramate dehydrogenase [Spirochaetaceae bacterium]
MSTEDNFFFIRDEPLSAHTTFCVGGPADFYLRPDGGSFPALAPRIVNYAAENKIPLFVLGGGANVLASDNGFHGIVLDTTDFSGCTIRKTGHNAEIHARAGTKSDYIAGFAAENSVAGVEFLAGLPGTIGGAVWMNARCYEKSLSDVLLSVTILDESLAVRTIPIKKDDFGYKKSPFQNRRVIILEACLTVKAGDSAAIQNTMAGFRKDRELKGHFSYPSAGSIFKNNRDFGKPAGKIIEELGLRGIQTGGAQIAPWHGNFIINRGNAAAADIHALIELIKSKAYDKLAINLEPEIIFLGFHNGTTGLPFCAP